MIDFFILFKNNMKYDANVLCNVFVFSLVLLFGILGFCMLKSVKMSVYLKQEILA